MLYLRGRIVEITRRFDQLLYQFKEEINSPKSIVTQKNYII